MDSERLFNIIYRWTRFYWVVLVGLGALQLFEISKGNKIGGLLIVLAYALLTTFEE